MKTSGSAENKTSAWAELRCLLLNFGNFLLVCILCILCILYTYMVYTRLLNARKLHFWIILAEFWQLLGCKLICCIRNSIQRSER